jgi:hypothetical protein
MMAKRFLLALLFIGFAASAHAQTDWRGTFGFGLGPTGGGTNLFRAGASMRTSAEAPRWFIEVGRFNDASSGDLRDEVIGLNTFFQKTYGTNLGMEGHVHATYVVVGGEWILGDHLDSKFKPFARGGLGLEHFGFRYSVTGDSRADSDVTGLTTHESATKPVLNAGIGAAWDYTQSIELALTAGAFIPTGSPKFAPNNDSATSPQMAVTVDVRVNFGGSK